MRRSSDASKARGKAVSFIRELRGRDMGFAARGSDDSDRPRGSLGPDQETSIRMECNWAAKDTQPTLAPALEARAQDDIHGVRPQERGGDLPPPLAPRRTVGRVIQCGRDLLREPALRVSLRLDPLPS